MICVGSLVKTIKAPYHDHFVGEIGLVVEIGRDIIDSTGTKINFVNVLLGDEKFPFYIHELVAL